MRRHFHLSLYASVAAALFAASGDAVAQAPGEASAVVPSDCNRECLIGITQQYMQALGARDPAKAPFAHRVRFTENNVELMIGKEGLWATISAVPAAGLEVADATTGEAAWIGTVQEHGLPVYYGMRIRVQQRAITEVETVVVRTTGLPLPFGDVSKLKHDPAFTEVLPPEQRRSRERLVAVANSYFSTVELNDGMVFAPFDEGCERTENGIYTTRAGTGSSGDIAQGCEQQFKLGLYRINKRVRERRYPIVDVERGVVVATGFFDHANEFDTYRTTDGKERKTLLKWPNSISLVEAFKIRDGRIYRIEAIFTYVPYFMHSPFYAYPEPVVVPEVAKNARKEPCDVQCLNAIADTYMEALVARDPSSVPWAPRVRYTENGVAMMIGEGIWGSARSKRDEVLRVADPSRASVVWYGVVLEHDAPAYYGMRLKVENRHVSEVEALVARARNPGPFADAARFKIDRALTAPLVPKDRQSPARMTALVERYGALMQSQSAAKSMPFDPACSRVENGANVSDGSGAAPVIAKVATAQGCERPLMMGLYKPLERIRNARIAAVDADRGLVVTLSLADYPVRATQYTTTDGQQRDTQDKYPSTRELLEIFKVSGGKLQRVEAISVFQPYGMPSRWIEK
jgi:hypothetical protein